MIRPSKQEYFMSLALLAAQRASCPRRKVGCVLVDANSYVVSTGYNGPPSGEPNCTDTPCGGQNQPSGQGLGLCKAIHAEINAYTQAGDRLGTVTDMFLTAGPCCPLCTNTTEELIKAKKLTNLKRIYFFDRYPTDTAKIFMSYGIELIHVDQNLDKNGMLFKLAVLLGFRLPFEEMNKDKVLCVGGALHGRMVTYSGNYMNADPSKCTPDELNSMYSFKGAERMDLLTITTHEYYLAKYRNSRNSFNIMRYSKLTNQEFASLFHKLRYNNLGEIPW